MTKGEMYYLIMVLLAFASFVLVVGKQSLEATRKASAKQDMPTGLTA